MELLTTGLGASEGVVNGRARVLAEPAPMAGLERGEILVCTLTDPSSFLDIIDHAAGVITDLGGLASHPAILCRELGIPCVVGTGDGTTVIDDGAVIVLDGAAGTIHAAG